MVNEIGYFIRFMMFKNNFIGLNKYRKNETARAQFCSLRSCSCSFGHAPQLIHKIDDFSKAARVTEIAYLRFI
jgi:hypothetical protein